MKKSILKKLVLGVAFFLVLSNTVSARGLEPDKFMQWVRVVRKGDLNEIQSFLNSGARARSVLFLSLVPGSKLEVFKVLLTSALEEERQESSNRSTQPQLGHLPTDVMTDAWEEALNRNNALAVKYLIEEYRVNPNRLSRGRPSLCSAHSLDVFQTLVSAGANLNIRHQDGMPSFFDLFMSAGYPIEVAEAWLKNVEDINMKWDLEASDIFTVWDSKTPKRPTSFLFEAASMCRTRLVRVALDAGADPSIIVDGMTLHEKLKMSPYSKIDQCQATAQLLRERKL